MEKGELAPGTLGAVYKSSPIPPSDVDAATRSNGTSQQSQQKTSEVEMATYPAAAPDAHDSASAAEANHGAGRASGANGSGGWGGKVRGKRALPVGQRDEKEDSTGLPEVESRPGTPSSSSDLDLGSDRTALLANEVRDVSGTGRKKRGVSNGNEAGSGDDYEDHPGVRRRALSSPRQGLLARPGREWVAEGSRGGGSEGEFEWRTKPLWYCGATLLGIGSLVNFASFGFAPQSLLASLGSVQFVSNVVFGKVRRAC